MRSSCLAFRLKFPAFFSPISAFLALSVALLPSMVSGQCPEWVKKDIVWPGDRADAPSGWYAYGRNGVNGVFKSPTNQFQPQVIPNTSGDRPARMELTYDGEWIVYLSSNNLGIYMIKPDGSGRTQVPVSGQSNNFPRSVGFIHNSPFGLEVMYTTSYSKVRAVTVDASGATPTFGNSRDVFDISNGPNSFRTATGGYTEHPMNGSHCFFQGVEIFSSEVNVRYPCYLTVPNSGQGTGTYNDIWRYTDLPDTSIYGCGFAFTPDGTRVLCNPGSQGDPACIPNRESGLDHKGFIMVPFYETGQPSMGIHEIVNDHGITSNFAPHEYRRDLHYEVDFTGWKFTNMERYVTGTLNGDRVTNKSVWLVDWHTNTWTELTEGSVEPLCAIAHLEDTSAAPIPTGQGQITYERWTNLSGTTVSDLTSSAQYPDNPASTSYPQTFEAPTNVGDNYGVRMHGFLHPTTTGSYTFWVASDDAGELWLSSDQNPSNAQRIANQPDFTSFRQWTKHTSQQSDPIQLTGGQTYYIMALMKDGSGEDHLSVSWQVPGVAQQIIPGSVLSPYAESAIRRSLPLRPALLHPGERIELYTVRGRLVGQTAGALPAVPRTARGVYINVQGARPGVRVVMP